MKQFIIFFKIKERILMDNLKLQKFMDKHVRYMFILYHFLYIFFLFQFSTNKTKMNDNFTTSLTNMAIAQEINYRNTEANIYIDGIIKDLSDNWKETFSDDDAKIKDLQELKKDLTQLNSDIIATDPRKELDALKEHCKQLFLIKDELKTYEHRSELLIKSNKVLLDTEENIHSDIDKLLNNSREKRKEFLNTKIKNILGLQ